MPDSRPLLHANLASFRLALDAAAELRSAAPREAALCLIWAVDEFIAVTPELAGSDAAHVLLDLASALADLDVGRVAPVLAPAKVDNRVPMVRQEKLIRAGSQYCIDKLMGLGLSLERACRMVAGELTAAGYQIDCQPDVPR